MEQYKIIVEEHVVDEKLKGFDIMQKPSSNVDYYGTNGVDTIFIQFKNGGSYFYPNVTKELIEEMLKSESIGKFMASLAKGGYGYTKFVDTLVKKKDQDDQPQS
jgi:hypothetical protein